MIRIGLTDRPMGDGWRTTKPTPETRPTARNPGETDIADPTKNRTSGVSEIC